MKGIATFTHVCAVLHLVTPRDAFLTCLTKYAIPRVPTVEGTEHVLSIKNTNAVKVNQEQEFFLNFL